ncbi:MAG: RNA-binding protein [Isosphaeraceae bacterium]
MSVLKQLHDELDAAVIDAYGWPQDVSDDKILRRLVELNRERAEEENRGIIRWLRPEYQNPGGVHATSTAQGALPIEPESPEASPAVAGTKRPWPKTLAEQAHAVRAVLAEQPTGLTPDQLARLFLRANTQRVTDMLDTLVSLGQARALEGGLYVPT